MYEATFGANSGAAFPQKSSLYKCLSFNPQKSLSYHFSSTLIFFSVQYLPQLTSSSIFPAVDNKRYYNNLRKFNYHLPNI